MKKNLRREKVKTTCLKMKTESSGRRQRSVRIRVERKHNNNEGRLKVKFPIGTNKGDIRRTYDSRDLKKD